MSIRNLEQIETVIDMLGSKAEKFYIIRTLNRINRDQWVEDGLIQLMFSLAQENKLVTEEPTQETLSYVELAFFLNS